MKNALRVFLGLFGVTAISIALLHIVYGPSAIPGSIPVNATMDSEDRFYATLFGAYGIALLSCIKGIEQKGRLVYVLALTFFAGGLARLVSLVAVGPPNGFFIAMTMIELIIPFIMAFMQSSVAKATKAQHVTAPPRVDTLGPAGRRDAL